MLRYPLYKHITISSTPDNCSKCKSKLLIAFDVALCDAEAHIESTEY